jgi:hypothetical protein
MHNKISEMINKIIKFRRNLESHNSNCLILNQMLELLNVIKIIKVNNLEKNKENKHKRANIIISNIINHNDKSFENFMHDHRLPLLLNYPISKKIWINQCWDLNS